MGIFFYLCDCRMSDLELTLSSEIAICYHLKDFHIVFNYSKTSYTFVQSQTVIYVQLLNQFLTEFLFM